MRTFAQYWVDDGRLTPCCQFADDEVIETDASVFQCATCPVAEAIDGLDTRNREAWQLFHRVCTRFLVETRAVGPALARLTPDLDADEFEDLMMRLSLLYDIYYPPKKDSRHGA